METESLEKMLEEQMREAAAAMDFELAAQLRDQLFEVRARRDASVEEPSRRRARRAVGGKCRTVRRHPAAGGARSPRARSEAELAEWGERFGRVASAPLVVTI